MFTYLIHEVESNSVTLVCKSKEDIMKKNLKKLMAMGLTIALGATTLVGCGSSSSTQNTAGSSAASEAGEAAAPAASAGGEEAAAVETKLLVLLELFYL